MRWLIFSNPDCKPPAKVWVVQSLLLLETFEITSSSRALHERAYLHHGAKIQILRRSPILGGDPLKDDNEEGAYILKDELWKKWIEIESTNEKGYANGILFGYRPCNSLWSYYYIVCSSN